MSIKKHQSRRYSTMQNKGTIRNKYFDEWDLTEEADGLTLLLPNPIFHFLLSLSPSTFPSPSPSSSPPLSHSPFDHPQHFAPQQFQSTSARRTLSLLLSELSPNSAASFLSSLAPPRRRQTQHRFFLGSLWLRRPESKAKYPSPPSASPPPILHQRTKVVLRSRPNFIPEQTKCREDKLRWLIMKLWCRIVCPCSSKVISDVQFSTAYEEALEPSYSLVRIPRTKCRSNIFIVLAGTVRISMPDSVYDLRDRWEHMGCR
ncbi:hypothetical protein C8R42DRAFT_329207 [Lentinula raphanica]|nr:hypothetical protein C8R42DRAFT_329207 [Lentinula raphanica]